MDEIHKHFKLEFIDNDEPVTELEEIVIYPSSDSDSTDETFYKLEWDNSYSEHYTYGGLLEDEAHEHYWEYHNLQQWYFDLDPDKSQVFCDDGFITLKLTCLSEEQINSEEEA